MKKKTPKPGVAPKTRPSKRPAPPPPGRKAKAPARAAAAAKTTAPEASSKSDLIMRNALDRNLRSQSKLLRACDRSSSDAGHRTGFRSLAGVEHPLREFVGSNAALENVLMAAVFAELSAIRTNSNDQFAALRIEDARWSGPLESVHLDIGAVRAAAWRVLAATSRNFIAKIVLRPPTADGANSDRALVCWRVEAIIWGDELEKTAEASIAKLRSRFHPIDSARDPLVLRWLRKGRSALAEAVTDAWRDPSLEAGPGSGSESGRKSRAASKERQRAWRAQMFRLLSMIDLKSTLLAGGDGKAVRNRVVQAATAFLRQADAGAPPIHAEGIVHFWVDVMASTGAPGPLPLVTYARPRTRKVPTARPREETIIPSSAARP